MSDILGTAIEAAFPDEKRGEWWTLERVLEMLLRDWTREHFGERRPLLSSTVYEEMAEFLADKTVSDLIAAATVWYRAKGLLGCRLAQRYNMKGEYRDATAAVAMSEKHGQMIYRSEKTAIRHQPSEPIGDWLVSETGVVRNRIIDA